MNKELIKNNKEAFEHWIEGGNVLFHYVTGWEILNGWGLPTETTIIINDEHVEYRKALAEGKIIQRCESWQEDRWTDLENPAFNLNENMYRIKPDEPEFKVGNYVYTNYGIKHLFETEACGIGYKVGGTTYSADNARKLWTLEEAGDDEMVLIVDMYHETFYSSRVFAINEDDKKHINKNHVKVVPYIQQSLKELGLEK